MLFVGGGVPAAARRAARLRLPMFPMNADPTCREAYFEEAKKIGWDGGFVIEPGGPTFVYVADDPERAWAEIGRTSCTRCRRTRRSRRRGSTRCRACTRRRSTTSSARRSTSSGPRTRSSTRCRRCPRGGGGVQPAGGRDCRRAGLAEPRAVRGQGVAGSFDPLNTLQARFGVPSGSPDRRSTMARYRRFDVASPGTPTSWTALRARRRALAAGRVEGALSDLELALAAPARTASSWIDAVRDALGALHEVWTRHIVETEAPGVFPTSS